MRYDLRAQLLPFECLLSCLKGKTERVNSVLHGILEKFDLETPLPYQLTWQKDCLSLDSTSIWDSV